MRPKWIMAFLLVISIGGVVPLQGQSGAAEPDLPDFITIDWTAEGTVPFGSFGASVGTAGDVNGDGFDDVIVGTSHYANGQSNEGRAEVYQGSARGLSTTSDWSVESNQTNAEFGLSVGTAGDVNGDGFDDVIVGAFQYDNGQNNEGRTFVYDGSATGLSTTPDWTAEGNQAEADFGISVGTAGDVNGDGFDDVIVGARYYDNGQSDEGRALVYQGSATGLSATPDWIAESNQAGALFGNSVGTAGDVNGDGFADVIVGAIFYANGQNEEGGAFVYQGSATGLSTTPEWTAEGDQAVADFGNAVGTAGDVNGDGYAEVIVGADLYSHGQDGEGRAFLYRGSATGLSTTPGWTAESNQAGALFGNSVGTAGDVNGDGFADVVVGAPFYENREFDEGRVFVYRGSSSGLSRVPRATIESNQVAAYLGGSVGGAGDVNGDGLADFIAGAYGWDRNPDGDEGGAVACYGQS